MAQKNEKLVKRINMVDVSQNTDRLPEWLDRIPALQIGNDIYKGTALFEWCAEHSKKQELEAGPNMNSKGGFSASPFSSLGNETVHSNFSEIGSRNGSEGIDSDKVSAMQKVEISEIEASRSADLRSMMR